MIPLRRLEKIPRSTRLRKIAQSFAEGEYRMGRGEPLGDEKISYYGELLGLLVHDQDFGPPAAEALNRAAARWNAMPQGERLRTLNTARHILLAETGRQIADWDCIDPQGGLDPKKRKSLAGLQVYLEDIRSPFNVGAMFRIAESFCVEKLILSPLCADPLHPRALRTAMGCVSILPWERQALDALKGPCFALETGGVPLDEFTFPEKAALITGSEELGVSPQALEMADRSLGRVSIPTYGAKGSLNVSAAFGIVMHAWSWALITKREHPLAPS
jgi:TrmH family RNA methyltransferase